MTTYYGIFDNQAYDLRNGFASTDYHDFNLAKIPQYVYELLKASDDAAVVSTENNYFWQGSLSNVELLDKHLNTIETFDD